MNPPGSTPSLRQHNQHHHHPMTGFPNPAAMGLLPQGMMFPSQSGASNPMAAMAAMGLPGADPALLAAAMSSMLSPGAMISNIHGYATAQQPVAEKTPKPAEPNNPASLWKEHRTTEGRIFWHNVKTNKSTWDKPDELRTDIERILATSTSWREYPSGEGDDKTYWHHLETKRSEWEIPEDVAEILNRIAKLDAENWSDKKFDGKSQAKSEFKIYLERKGIGHKGRWEDVGRVLQADPKWKIFDSILTTGERKHIFNEHVNQLQKKTREEQRIKKAAARDTLAEFLSKWRVAEVGGAPMAADVTYADFEDLTGDQQWFQLLEPIDIAEALEESAQQVADEMFNRPSKARQDELTKLFADAPEDILPLNASIERIIQVATKCSESLSPPLHPVTILSAWQRHVRGWAWNRRHKAKRTLYREERKIRDAFRGLLNEAEDQGLLDAKSEWTTFLKGPRPTKKFRATEEGEVNSSIGRSPMNNDGISLKDNDMILEYNNQKDSREEGEANSSSNSDHKKPHEPTAQKQGEDDHGRGEEGFHSRRDHGQEASAQAPNPEATFQAQATSQTQGSSQTHATLEAHSSPSPAESKFESDVVQPMMTVVGEAGSVAVEPSGPPPESTEDLNQAVDGSRSVVVDESSAVVVRCGGKVAEMMKLFEMRQEAWEVVDKVCSRVGDNGRVCDDLRYLCMFVQGGSTARELFEDFVYGLWDVYEALRSQVKNAVSASSELGQALLSSSSMMSQEKFGKLLLAESKIDMLKPDLWKLSNRPGVLAPLQASLAKRLRRAAEEPEQH